MISLKLGVSRQGTRMRLVYEATYYAKNEGGRGLERMREVRISACFARETVKEIAPWNLSFKCKVIDTGTCVRVCDITVFGFRRILPSYSNLRVKR